MVSILQICSEVKKGRTDSLLRGGPGRTTQNAPAMAGRGGRFLVNCAGVSPGSRVKDDESKPLPRMGRAWFRETTTLWGGREATPPVRQPEAEAPEVIDP